MTASEPPITVELREWNAQLCDALGDMIHEFGAGAGWRTEKQEAALAKALQVFLGLPVVERDDTAELVAALRSATFLARTYYERYITEAMWDHEPEEKWPEELHEDRGAINRASEVLVRHSAALARVRSGEQ